jgi:hypothetical protein
MTRRIFTVRDTPGIYVYVGQCYYVDDDGQTVEHDWLRLAPLDGDGDTLWVPPQDAFELVDQILAALAVESA